MLHLATDTVLNRVDEASMELHFMMQTLALTLDDHIVPQSSQLLLGLNQVADRRGVVDLDVMNNQCLLLPLAAKWCVVGTSMVSSNA